MSFKTASFTSVGNRGLNPTISLSRTRRVENPVWNFTLPYTFQGTVAGYTSGGRFSPVGQGEASDVIDKFPFATNANATDVGDLTAVPGVGIAGDGRRNVAGQSSDVSGYTSGGYNPSAGPPTATNIIDKFPFATDSNATNIGYLTSGGGAYGTGFPGVAGQSSETHGYSSGGNIFVESLRNIIDRFSFASDGNATDVGDLTQARAWAAGQQN